MLSLLLLCFVWLQECVQLTSKCTQLQDRTMALAKELASLKLWDQYLIFCSTYVFQY